MPMVSGPEDDPPEVVDPADAQADTVSAAIETAAAR
jgi:hypothetical protein